MKGTWDLGPHVNWALFATLDLGTTIGSATLCHEDFLLKKIYHFLEENGVLRKDNIFLVLKVCLVLFVIELGGKWCLHYLRYINEKQKPLA